MDIDEFRAELETRLLIEKQYLVREASSFPDEERLELLGKFNEKYKELIKRLALENGIDLQASYSSEMSSDSSGLSNEQIILGRTMAVYDRLSDELYEEIINVL